MPKIVQISSHYDCDELETVIVALCDDGAVWVAGERDKEWCRITREFREYADQNSKPVANP